MFARLTERVTQVPAVWFAAAVFFLSFSLIGLTKVGLRLLVPDEAMVAPYYGIAGAGGVLVFGLFDSSWRGLLLSALGSVVGAIGIVALAVLRDGQWAIFVFALPIAIVGAAGLGIFGHGILHAVPAVARIGFKVILFGYAASILLAGVGLPFLDVRRDFHGSDPATIALAAVSVVCVLIAGLVIVVGLRVRDRQVAGNAGR